MTCGITVAPRIRRRAAATRCRRIAGRPHASRPSRAAGARTTAPRGSRREITPTNAVITASSGRKPKRCRPRIANVVAPVMQRRRKERRSRRAGGSRSRRRGTPRGRSPSRSPPPASRARSRCGARTARGRPPAGCARSRCRASRTASGSASPSGSRRRSPRRACSRTSTRRRCSSRSCRGRCTRRTRRTPGRGTAGDGTALAAQDRLAAAHDGRQPRHAGRNMES